MTDLAHLIHTNAHLAKTRMIAEIHAHWDEIERLALERCSSVGVDEYGDASFRKTRQRLREERFEEYADALFYFQVEHRATE